MYSKRPDFYKDQKETVDPGTIYYNIKITNTANIVVDAKYNETRTTNIIDGKLSDYELAVARFKIPTNSIPIFTFDQLNDISGNPVQSAYTITLTTTTFEYTRFCFWIPSGTQQFAVWTYTEWAQSITNAFQTAYAAMGSDPDQPSCPPFVLYDSNTQKFSLYATDEYSSTFGDGKVGIWMNAPCFQKIESWQGFFSDEVLLNANKYINIYVYPNGTNQIVANFAGTSGLNCSPAVDGKTYFQMEQEYSALFLLSDLDSILLQCNKIPVNRELVSSGYTSEDSSDQTVSNSEFITMLTDYDLVSNNEINNHSYAEYNPFQYRWASLLSNSSLRDMDITIAYRNIKGTITPITLSYMKVASVKLAFRKKSKS